jgi:hypothetical protein
MTTYRLFGSVEGAAGVSCAKLIATDAIRLVLPSAVRALINGFIASSARTQYEQDYRPH